MALPLALLAGSVLAPIAGGILGNMASAGDRASSSDIAKRYYDSINSINLPDEAKMRLALEQQQYLGDMTPEQEQEILLSQHDAMQDVNTDPRLKQTLMNNIEALNKSGMLGDKGQLDPSMQADLNKNRRQVAADAQAQLRQQLENQQRQGIGSSEAALAARLISGQGAANRQSEESDRLASMAYQNALQARAGAGSLASQLQNSDFNQQAQIAQALNQRELTNTNLATNTHRSNIDRTNQAMQINRADRQNLANTNTGIRNQEQQFNRQLPQQQFNNQLARAGLQGNAATMGSNAASNAANATAGMYSGIGMGAGQILGGLASQQMKDDKKATT